MAPKRRAIDIDSALATATRTAESEATATRLPDTTSRGPGTLTHVPISAVTPNIRNVRRTLLDVEELAESIASEGVLQPLVVRPITDRERPQYDPEVKYIIVMGERRHAGSKLAGLDTVPVVVRTDIAHDNEIKLMMVENLQRRDLNPIDEGLGYRQLIEELELSQRAVAKVLGIPQARISRRLALLDLDTALQDQIAADRVGVDVATAHLVKLDQPAQAEVAARLAAQPDREWDPADIRKLAEQVTQEAVIRGIRSDQRDRARTANADTYESFDELPDDIRERPKTHQLRDAGDIATAGRLGNLLAVITDYRTGPDWYLRDPAGAAPPAPAASPRQAVSATDQPDADNPARVDAHNPETGQPEPDDVDGVATEQSPTAAAHADDSPTVEPDDGQRDAQQDQAEARRSDAELITSWAQDHRRVKRPELEGFARWFLERIPDDEASILVRTWLNDDQPHESWKLQLANDSYTESALRAAFLYAVATDYLEAQATPDSAAGRRTAGRLAEQEEKHRD